MKRLLRSLIRLAADQFTCWFNEAADGIEEHDIEKVAINCICIIVWGVALALIGLLIVLAAIGNMHLFVIGGFLAAALYSGILKLNGEEIVEDALVEEPTASDYYAVLETIRPAVAEVAQALELAPIYSHTDMTADSEERILPWGKIWRMKYKVLKKNVATSVDTDQCRRIIQAQVKTVLERDNPSGFAVVRFQRGSGFEPIVQIDEIMDGDAYIYIFAAIASDQYFRQKAQWKNRSNVLAVDTSADDPLFR